jgi:hypothetical protein
LPALSHLSSIELAGAEASGSFLEERAAIRQAQKVFCFFPSKKEALASKQAVPFRNLTANSPAG